MTFDFSDILFYLFWHPLRNESDEALNSPAHTQTSKHSFLARLLILGSLTAIGPLSVDMYLPALPEIARHFKSSLASVEMSLASYFLGLAIGQVFYGPFIDRLGRKPPLFFGLAIYFLSSIACFFASSVHVLVAARFFQALGGCASIVVPRAIVRDLYEEREAARVFSLLMLVMGLAPILAPLIGGYVTLYLGWRTIFSGLALISLLCLSTAFFFLPETAGSFSVRGSILKTYANILSDRRFFGPALAGSIAQAGMFAYITGSPFVFIEFFGIAANNYGWIFGSNALLLIAMSQINARLLKRHSPMRILRTVFALIALSSSALLLSSLLNLGLIAHIVSLGAFVGLLGATFPNTTAVALAHEGTRAGSASALLGTLQFTMAAIAAGVISLLHAKSSLPMAGVVSFCGISSFLVSRFSFKRP